MRLTEWVTRSRIIMNMLNELMRYCPNKEHGCEWTGEQERLRTHLGVRSELRCRARPRCGPRRAGQRPG